MWYAIISEDVDDSLEVRTRVRPAHVERIAALNAEGRVLVAGPHPRVDQEDPGSAGFSGSLLVAEFDSLADAQVWADADPFVTEGVYGSVVVKPFKKSFP